MNAPGQLNVGATAEAWDDPSGFARELNRYYSQLEAAHDEKGTQIARTPDGGPSRE